MQKYQDSIQNLSGQALAGLSVLVKTYPAGATATIYSDDGVTLASNPLTTDLLGAFGFYAANGRYQLVVSGTGITSLTISDILLEDIIAFGATGTGSIVHATGPTVVTPALGTPVSGTLTNCDGLPAAGVSGTALVNGGALGTPSSGALTNCTFPTLNQDTTGYASALKSATTTVNVSSATAPTSGQVLTATGDTAATWQTPAGGGGVTWTIITADPSPAISGSSYMANTSSAGFSITLPAAPSANETISICDYTGTFATNNLTVGRNALKIMGLAEDLILNVNYVSITLTYIDATEGWVLT